MKFSKLEFLLKFSEPTKTFLKDVKYFLDDKLKRNYKIIIKKIQHGLMKIRTQKTCLNMLQTFIYLLCTALLVKRKIKFFN